MRPERGRDIFTTTAETLIYFMGRTAQALPLDELQRLVVKYRPEE